MLKRSLITANILLATSLFASENLGLITVESTTIDDKFETKKDEISNTTTLHTKDIEKSHDENLGNILNKIPGVTATINEGDSLKIHIRGISNEVYMGEKPGVAIVIDGVPVQERAGSVNIDIDNIESIKVIKGGASYLYGNDALGGAVVITTKRAKAKTQTTITAERGSFNYEKYLIKQNIGSENFAIELQGTYKASDGYWEDSDYWNKSINGKFQYYIDDSSDITFGIDKTKRYENDTGSITAVVGGVNQIKNNPKSFGEVGYSTDYNIDLDKYFLTYSKDFENDSSLLTQVYRYEDLTTNLSGAYDAIPNNGILRDGHYAKSYANTIQTGIKSEYRIDGDSFASMLGFDFAKNEEEKNRKYIVDYTSRGRTFAKGTYMSDTDFSEKIIAVYGEMKYKINEKLTTTANLRFDKMKYDYTNKLNSKNWEKDFNEQSYRLGANYKLKKDTSIFTNFTTGFRVPTISQLYAGDILSGRYSYDNNTNLKTEKTYNYEIGLRGKESKYSYEVSAFNLDRKDVIARNGGTYVAPLNENIKYTNDTEIQSRGIELDLKTKASDKLSFNLGYTFLDTTYKKYDKFVLVVDADGDPNTRGSKEEGTYNLAGKRVPRVSKHNISLTTDYKLNKNLLFTNELIYKSSQYADELNRVKVGGYGLVNLRASYKSSYKKIKYEFFTKVDNVLDKQYYMMPRATGDRNSDGSFDAGDMGLTVNPGRFYLAGISLKF